MLINKIKKTVIPSILILAVTGCSFAQSQEEAYKDPENRRSNKAVYTNANFHEVKTFPRRLI